MFVIPAPEERTMVCCHCCGGGGANSAVKGERLTHAGVHSALGKGCGGMATKSLMVLDKRVCHTVASNNDRFKAVNYATKLSHPIPLHIKYIQLLIKYGYVNIQRSRATESCPLLCSVCTSLAGQTNFSRSWLVRLCVYTATSCRSHHKQLASFQSFPPQLLSHSSCYLALSPRF